MCLDAHDYPLSNTFSNLSLFLSISASPPYLYLTRPHVVIDNLIDDSVIRNVAKEVEHALNKSRKEKGWRYTTNKDQYRKYGTSDVRKTIGRATHELISELKSINFIGFLERVTNIPGLIPGA